MGWHPRRVYRRWGNHCLLFWLPHPLMSKESCKDLFTSFNYCFLLLDLEIHVLSQLESRWRFKTNFRLLLKALVYFQHLSQWELNALIKTILCQRFFTLITAQKNLWDFQRSQKNPRENGLTGGLVTFKVKKKNLEKRKKKKSLLVLLCSLWNEKGVQETRNIYKMSLLGCRGRMKSCSEFERTKYDPTGTKF